MSKELVVVESPAKARTVGRFLGSKYATLASMGHVRDLPKGKMGVDIDDKGFHPTYTVLPDKKKVVSELRKASKDADTVYLATDPDREGEAISWHLLSAAKIAPSKIKRVVFHEITREAINEAFEHPRELDYNLIDAQQARRILDRLVGYRLSPVLWGKVKRGLSAGRVQSVALRLVVDREREIDAFVPVEYWTIDAKLAKPSQEDGKRIQFMAALHSVKGDKKKMEIPNGERAAELVSDLDSADYSVASVRKRETRRRPAAPFITSTMQQEAARKLGFTARRTMQVAQQLYEGISVGADGTVGLITYMRTDSTNVAGAALREAGEYIKAKFGDQYAPKSPRIYTKKVKGAQEAHEAIRPTSILRTPEAIRQHLSAEQFRLYDLIWKRLVASQMNDALFDSTRVDIDATSKKSTTTYLFRASGSVLKFPGFRALYMEGSDDISEDENTPPLPDLAASDPLDCLGIVSDQHFTQPPPRYTEARLIRTMEEQGIGRPSTYAPTIATILDRDYVQKDKSAFVPTRLGIVVTDLLTANFPDVMSVGFTAMMEEQLDDIAEGERAWEPMLKDFYGPFDQSIEKTMKEAERVPRELLDEQTDQVCEKCESPMVIKSGRYGRFLACTGYPECKNTRPVESEEERTIRERISEQTDEICEKCERPMAVKTGRNGRFLACTGYPECKNAKPLPVGVDCPDCSNPLVERKQKGRTGRIFYSCSDYPTCKFTVNPLAQPCPDCGELLVSQGRSNKNARCLNKECEYKGAVPQKQESLEGAA